LWTSWEEKRVRGALPARSLHAMRPHMARSPRITESPARAARKSKSADRVAALEEELAAERRMRAEQTALAEEAHARIQELQLALMDLLRLVAEAEAREVEAGAVRSELARAAASLLVSRPRRAKGPPPLPGAKIPTMAPPPEVDVTDTAELIESMRPPGMTSRRSDVPR
jgi:hypothetical protein